MGIRRGGPRCRGGLGHRDGRRCRLRHPLIERPDRIDGAAAVGVDETAFARAAPGARQCSPPESSTCMAASSSTSSRGEAAVLADWQLANPPSGLPGIEVTALDPFRGYGAALSAGLPQAVRVLDAFHVVVRLGFAAVDDVRRRVQQHTCGHRGRRDDPLYRIRRVLRRGAEHHHHWLARLLAGIEAGDHDGQVAAAWVAAQELRAIYRCHDRDQAAARLYDWTVTCIDSHARAATAGANPHHVAGRVPAYFSTGRISNAPPKRSTY